jgi:glycosyltransferase involved in cell wall biosynthesis
LPYLNQYLDTDIVDLPMLSYDLKSHESLGVLIRRVIREVLENRFARPLKKNGINIYTVRSLCVGDFGSLCSIAQVNVLLKKLSKNKYNAVLATPWIAGFISLILRRDLRGIPIIYEDVDRFYDFFKNMIKRVLVKTIEYYTIVNSDAVIAVSPHIYFEDLELRKKKYTYFIPNGIEYEKFRNSVQRVIERERFATVYVGAIEWWSGLDIAIRVFQKVATVIPQAKLYIIGDDKTSFGRYLKKLVKDYNLSANVIFMGRRSYDFVINFLPRCRIGILTFPSSEVTSKAFPYKVLEYAASGLPIVMTNVSAIASIVKLWRAGFVYSENDIEGIATSIIELMTNDYLWREYSARAVEMASFFDVKRLAYKEAQILRSFVS